MVTALLRNYHSAENFLYLDKPFRYVVHLYNFSRRVDNCKFGNAASGKSRLGIGGKKGKRLNESRYTIREKFQSQEICSMMVKGRG
jgi:hypothetical protein